jgi:Uma2 family endonuclease
MLAAPTTQHQRISSYLHYVIFNYLLAKPCEVFAAPFDVRLFEASGEKKKKYLRIYRKEVVVQPDLSIVCDPDQLDEKGCNGAPAMVVEILSPSNKHYQEKVNAYMSAGIQEIWIVDPGLQTIFLYLRRGKDYVISTFEASETLASPTFPGLESPLQDIFPAAPTTNTKE